MISIEQAKKLLNNPDLTDKEVECARDEMRMLAEMIFEVWQKDKNKNEKRKKNLNTQNN